MMQKSLVTAALLASSLITPVMAEDLRIAMPTFTDVFHPADWGNDTAPMFYQVFETLITRDPFASPLQYVPGLATSWEQVEPTIWELKLREGVAMHDGTVMDAEDVKASLDPIFSGEDSNYKSA